MFRLTEVGEVVDGTVSPEMKKDALMMALMPRRQLNFGAHSPLLPIATGRADDCRGVVNP